MSENTKVSSKIELLPHNQELYDKIVEQIEKGEKSIFYSQATGLGKSFIFMKLVEDYFQGKRIMYVVPKIAIWKNLTRYKEFNYLNADIVMTTYAAFNKYDYNLCNEYDVVFIDECHHMLSEIQGNNIHQFCKDMNATHKYSFGFTATPYYKGNYVDEECFNVSCYGYDICEAINLGLLPKIHFSVANINIDDIPIDMKARYSIIGTKTLLEQLLERNINKNKWIAYFLNKTELEQNVHELKTLFPDYTILKVYDGVEDEDSIYDAFNSSAGKVILLSVNKLLEGVHLKNVQGVLLYRNVTEFSTYMQMYGRLCDISTKESPIFLDVANAVFSINKVSEVNIFKSSRCENRLNHKIKDFFDVHADDYWTVELMDVIKNTPTVKRYKGLEWYTRQQLAKLLNRDRKALDAMYKACRDSMNVDESVVDRYLKDYTYDEYVAAGYIGKYKCAEFEYTDYVDLAKQLNTTVTFSSYAALNTGRGIEVTVEDYILYHLTRDDKKYYKGVNITTKSDAARHFGKVGASVSSWCAEKEGRTIEMWVDHMFQIQGVYRNIPIGSYRIMSETLGVEEHIVENYAKESRYAFVDYMLDVYNTEYRGFKITLPEENRCKLHITSTDWRALGGNELRNQKDIIDYLYGIQYRGVIPTNILILEKQLGISRKFINKRKKAGLSYNEIIDAAYVYKESQGVSNEDYQKEIVQRRIALGYVE